MNNIIITGRLGHKPELKTAANGTEYTKFTVAVDRRKVKDKPQETDWFNCSAFGKMASFICQYFDKGRGIEISGRMESSKKDDKTYWNLVCENVEFPKETGKKDEAKKEETPDGFTPDNEIPF